MKSLVALCGVLKPNFIIWLMDDLASSIQHQHVFIGNYTRLHIEAV